MALEIERKFLLKKLPKTKYDDKLEIIQFYCLKPKVRIRRTISADNDLITTTYFKTTKKLIKPGVYDEQEKEITRKKAIDIVRKSAVSFISKTRYIKKFGKLKWEIDVFGNDMKLIVAEIELPKENHKITIPKYIKKELVVEVTTMMEFTNKNLAELRDQLPKMIL